MLLIAINVKCCHIVNRISCILWNLSKFDELLYRVTPLQLIGKYAGVRDMADKRRALLEDAKEFQVFKRDAGELKAWLLEKIESLTDEIGADNVEVNYLTSIN